MKVAVFSTHTVWYNHLETELEIAQNHINKGHSLDFYRCNERYFKFCENILSAALKNYKNYSDINDTICEFCIKRQNDGYNLLKGSHKMFDLINKDQLQMTYKLDITYLENVEKFKTLFNE
jgi:hypothetical protein